MSIGAKMAEAAKMCRYMPKDGYNSYQKYKYTTAAGLLAKVNEAFSEQGLYTSTSFEMLDLRDVQSQKGNTEKHAVVKVTITIKDSEDPEGVVIFEGIGSGQDAGDKALMKANTAALKYAYIGGLNIARSDDPEQDSGTEAYANYAPAKPAPKANGNTDIVGKCEKCGKAVTGKVADFSQKKFGKRLCYNCQPKTDANNPF